MSNIFSCPPPILNYLAGALASSLLWVPLTWKLAKLDSKGWRVYFNRDYHYSQETEDVGVDKNSI